MQLAERPFAVTTALAALTCALAPAYVIRWHIGPLPSTVLEAAIIVTVLAFIVESARTRIAFRWKSPFTIPAALFLVSGAMAVVVSPEHIKCLGLYRAYLIEPVAFFFVLGNVLLNAQRALLVLLGLATGGAVAGAANSVVVADAIWRHTLNLALPPPVVIYQTSNATALYLVPLIGIAASLVLYERNRNVRLVSAAFLVVCVVSTLLSLSRAGVIALGVLALILAAMNRRRMILVPGLVALGIAAAFVPAVSSRLSHEFNPSDPNNTLLSRVHLWQVTLHLLDDHPIFGTGLFGFAKSIQPYRGGVYEEKLIYPHNLFLNFWTELGILGLVSFIWLFVQAFRMSWQGWVKGALSWRSLQLGIILALVAIFVHGMVDVPYFKNDLALEFWVFLGVAWAGAQELSGEHV